MQLVCTALIPEPFASLMFYTLSNQSTINKFGRTVKCIGGPGELVKRL